MVFRKFLLFVMIISLSSQAKEKFAFLTQSQLGLKPFLHLGEKAAIQASARFLLNARTKQEMYTNILQKCINNEKKYRTTHVFAYHGHSGLMQGLQDVYGIYFSVMNNIRLKDYIFFRNPREKIGDLSTLAQVGQISDHEPHLRKSLLSASLNCSISNLGESALHFFEYNDSMIVSKKALTQELFEKLKDCGLSEKTISNLKEVYTKAPAALTQIFLPRHNKTFFEKYAYICGPFGYKNSTKSVVEQIDFMRKNPSLFSSSNMIENESFSSRFQIRLALGNDFFANPQSGIRMKRFQDPQEAKAFEPLKKNILEQVKKDIKKVKML